MAIKLPDFSSLGFNDPQSSGRLPQYPQEDAGAVGLATLGKGLQSAGGAALDYAADQQRRHDKLTSTLAEADFATKLYGIQEALKNEGDPAKIDALRGQIQTEIDTSGAAITDPDTRALWGAKRKLDAAKVEGLAQERQLKIWHDRNLAGSRQLIDDQRKIAAQASDPADREAAQRRIGDIVGSLEQAGTLSATDSQKAASALGQGMIEDHAEWLSANGRNAEAQEYLRKNGGLIDPGRLRAMNDRLRPRVDADVGRGWVDRETSGNINYGASGALGDPREPGWEAKNLTTISSPGGAKFRVHKEAAPAFEGLVKDLEGMGYVIKPGTSGGHNLRKRTGSDTELSEHAYGTAIDINSDVNLYTRDGKKVTDLPPEVGKLAEKHGLIWGGNWKDPVDTMHFQWRGPKGTATATATVDAPPDRVDNVNVRANNFGGIRRAGMNATAAEGGFEKYPTAEAGVKAIADNLDRYAAGGVATAMNPSGAPIDTIRGIVSVWAPPNENNTEELIKRAAKNTGFGPDDKLDMRDPGTKAKVVEAIIRNEHGDKLPVSRSVISRVAGGDQSRRTDWGALIERANNDPSLTPEQRDMVKREIAQKRSEQALGQAEAASDLTLAVMRGEKGEAEIEAEYNKPNSLIAPEVRTRLIGHVIEEQKKQALRDQAIVRVSSAMTGGAPLDPKSEGDRKALNLHFAAASRGWVGKPEADQEALMLQYAQQAGMVPDALKASIRGGLHSGRPEMALAAVEKVNWLRNANPQLLGEIGDENDLRLATLVNERVQAGVAPEMALRQAVASLKVGKTERDARAEDFDLQRGKTPVDRKQKDDQWLGKQLDSWAVNDPNIDPQMRADFEGLARDEFQRSGNLEAARRQALDNVNRVWGRSRVGGDYRYLKFAPEKFYGVPALSADENSGWMTEQLLKDTRANAFQDPNNPITADRLRVLADPTRTAPDGRPVYQVWLQDPNGAWTHIPNPDGTPRAWFPDWERSDEKQRRQNMRSQDIERLRDLRRPQTVVPFPDMSGATP